MKRHLREKPKKRDVRSLFWLEGKEGREEEQKKKNYWGREL